MVSHSSFIEQVTVKFLPSNANLLIKLSSLETTVTKLVLLSQVHSPVGCLAVTVATAVILALLSNKFVRRPSVS